LAGNIIDNNLEDILKPNVVMSLIILLVLSLAVNIASICADDLEEFKAAVETYNNAFVKGDINKRVEIEAESVGLADYNKYLQNYKTTDGIVVAVRILQCKFCDLADKCDRQHWNSFRKFQYQKETQRVPGGDSKLAMVFHLAKNKWSMEAYIFSSGDD
jgi:hypothetical protein